MKRNELKKAFGVNIAKQNCLKTAFDMRDFCCCAEWWIQLADIFRKNFWIYEKCDMTFLSPFANTT